MRAVKNRAQRWVFEALIDIEQCPPFALLRIDSDNGVEFIIDQLLRYCTSTRTPSPGPGPYRKNDNCFIEQKNWTVVRQSVGFGCFEGEAALEILMSSMGGCGCG
jgi:hypothetical protein